MLEVLEAAICHTTAHLFWIAVCCHFTWQMDANWPIVQTSLSHAWACAKASCDWDGGCQVRDEGALLETNLPLLELIPPSSLLYRQATVTPGKSCRVTILKPLLWLVNFDQPFMLNVGRWLIKNIMLMGYILGGLFQTWNSALPASQIVVLTQMRQWGKGGAEEGIPQAGFATKENVGRSTASVHGLCAWGLSRKDCKASKWLSWFVPKHIKVKEIKFLWWFSTFWKI